MRNSIATDAPPGSVAAAATDAARVVAGPPGGR